MEGRDEAMRQLIEAAHNYGKKRKSLQTGYIHYCYNTQDQEPHQTIPLVENFLYALTLFRSRLIENITEAKVMLDALLHFQNTEDGGFAKGNFPIYLHEYPICKDRFTGINVAAAIYAILQHFHQVVGADLNHRLESALSMAVEHSLETYLEKGAPYTTAVKIAVLSALTGKLLGNQEMARKGESLLHTLANANDEIFRFSPASLGSVTLSLSLVYPRIADSPFSGLWEYLEKTWHRRTASFAGPSLKEWQYGSEPQVTIYDLLLGYYTGVFSKRAMSETPAHLEAALLFPSVEVFQQPELPVVLEGEVKGSRWKMHNSDRYALSYVESGGIDLNPVYEKGFHPYRLVWGDTSKAHTFVCQGGMSKEASFTASKLTFDLEGDAEAEDREKAREVMFYVDAYDGMEFSVSDKKSSTFQLGEEVVLKDKHLSLTLNFRLEQGAGRFLGHRMPGNRPSQLTAKGNARYDAYDWQVFLRSVSREEPCKILVDVRISDVN